MAKRKLVELMQTDYPNGISMLFLKSVYQREFYSSPIIAKPLSNYYFFEIKKDDKRGYLDLVEEVAKIEEEKIKTKNPKLKSPLLNRNSFLIQTGRVSKEDLIPAMVKFYDAQLPEGLENLDN